MAAFLADLAAKGMAAVSDVATGTNWSAAANCWMAFPHRRLGVSLAGTGTLR